MAGSGSAHLRERDATLLRAENLVVEFPVGSTGLKVHAVSDVSLDAGMLPLLGFSGLFLTTPLLRHRLLPGWLAANARSDVDAALAILPDRASTWEAVANDETGPAAAG